MFFEAMLAAVLISLASLVGVFLFGHDKRLIGAERFVVPVAVGVFLSLVVIELIPETMGQSEVWGGVVIMLGFLAFYVLSHKLHQRYHDKLEEEDCDRRGAAMLLLIGDSVHNFADGVVLGGAFLVDPAVGMATAIGLALHEVPQEIVEFGVLVRAGYTRMQAALRNLLSASTIIVGTVLVMLLSSQLAEYVWVLTGLAAGNLLFLAASDLLPRIHGNLSHYHNIWYSTISIALGFVLMTVLISWVHERYDSDHNEAEVHFGDGLDDH